MLPDVGLGDTSSRLCLLDGAVNGRPGGILLGAGTSGEQGSCIYCWACPHVEVTPLLFYCCILFVGIFPAAIASFASIFFLYGHMHYLLVFNMYTLLVYL